MTSGGWIRAAIRSFLEYETPHIIHIHSKKVGILSRLIQLLIIAYIVGYVIVWNKGYQQFSGINSSVTTKLKGVVSTNFTDEQFVVPNPEIYRRIWDVSEYVVPPQENGAFFVMTNVIITPNQTRNTQCAEDARIPGSKCNNTDNKCVQGEYVVNGNGIMTGQCVPTGKENVSTCEITAWCPVETGEFPLGPHKALLEGSRNFTVLLKNSIEFPLFNIKRRNVLNSSNKTYLESCHYNPDTDPSCPIFKLDTIVREAGENYSDMAVEGGVVAIIINWDCNLDRDLEKHCIPTYRFNRLDNPDAQIARGWNFRYSTHYSDVERTLYKAYGIRFVVLVEGRAGKFNMIPLLLNVGSGLALLGLATVFCDIVVLYCVHSRDYYREKKYTFVRAAETEPLLGPKRTDDDLDYCPIRGDAAAP